LLGLLLSRSARPSLRSFPTRRSSDLRVLGLDLGFPAVLVGAHALDGFDRFPVHAFADLELGRLCHLSRHDLSLPVNPLKAAPHAARAANRTRAASHAAAKPSISSSVVRGPIETRMAEAAATSSSPIAASTRLGRTLPLEQADPAETAKPARSICITCVSPFQPGVTRQEVLGSRGPPRPTIAVSGAASSTRASSRSRKPATPSQTPASWSASAARAAAPKPAMPATFSVPDRRPIS